ncbi:MAG: serine protease, partial [Gemmata sp.]
AGALAAAAPAEPPRFVDDDKVYKDLYDKIEELARANKPLAHKKLLSKMKSAPAKVALARPGDKALTPEEVYKQAAPSVFIVGSVYPDNKGNWESGTYATAWCATGDGVLVTNWHVFDDLKDAEVFGAADRDGNVYPVTDFLGGDKTADVAVFRISAKGLKPLPVATDYAEVGAWVGLVSHPGDLFYLFTQGHVTRYSTNKNEDGNAERWMGVTAEYASGSSGAPMLNKYGAVVGMAALTLSLDAPAGAGGNPERRAKARPLSPRRPSRADDKKEPPKPENKGSTLQMVVKMAVPGPTVVKWVGK